MSTSFQCDVLPHKYGSIGQFSERVDYTWLPEFQPPRAPLHESHTDGLTAKAVGIIDCFVEQYDLRIRDLLKETGSGSSSWLDSSPGAQGTLEFEYASIPSLVEYFLTVVTPFASRAKARLSVRSSQDIQTMMSIGDDLLELVDSDSLPLEREDALYSIGRQYWTRLQEEGLLRGDIDQEPEYAIAC